jgi:hypothetical protein
VNELDHLAWLLGPSPDPGGKKPRDADIADACDFLLREWQILPAVLPALIAWAGTRGQRHPDVQRVRDRATALRLFGRIQLKIGLRLITLMQHAGVPYVLLKGSAARLSAYPDPEERCGKDIDIAVPARHLDGAQKLARDVGFVAAQWSPAVKRFRLADPILRAAVEAGHYELGFYARHQVVTDISPEDDAAIRRDMPSQYLWHTTADDRLACYTSIDIHHGLNLDIPVDPVVRSARIVAWRGANVRVPAPEWSVLFLIFKIYWEGTHTYGKGLYQYADLARQIVKFTTGDVAALRKTLAQYQLEVPAYYVLRRLSGNLATTLAPELTDFLDHLVLAPSGDEVDAMAFNDFGDMWPKLWGYR